MSNKLFVFGTLGVAIILFTVVFYKKQKVTTESPPQITKTIERESNTKTNVDLADFFVRPHSPRIGNKMARVTVVEWLDPECEACRAMHPIVERIIEDYKDRVLFVVRYMTYHKGSMFASTALEEAREFGKFKEALNTLFKNQPEWGGHHNPRPDLIPTYLEKIGIPLENLDRDKLLTKHGHKIRQDLEDGEKAGVSGTPSFFINGTPLKQLGETTLRLAIDRQLTQTMNQH